MSKRIKNKKQKIKSNVDCVAIEKVEIYIIDLSSKKESNVAFQLAKHFETLGLEVYSVLSNTQIIIGKCTDTICQLIKQHKLVKNIEINGIFK